MIADREHGDDRSETPGGLPSSPTIGRMTLVAPTLIAPIRTRWWQRLSRRGIAVGVAAAVAYVLAVGIPTTLIPNPIFGREIPPTWWAWPSLLLTAVLVGLLTATYIAPTKVASPLPGAEEPTPKKGVIGAALTYFAVGCPVCNKIVLLALGWNGALTWFQPFQPVLQVAAIALLAWAIWQRFRNLDGCVARAAA